MSSLEAPSIAHVLAQTATERARLLSPYVLGALVFAVGVSEPLGVGLARPVIAYNAAVIAALTALLVALRTRRWPERWGHAALMALWVATLGGTLISEAWSREQHLHAVLLVEMCALAIQLHTGMVIAAAIGGFGASAPLIVRDTGAAAPIYVVALGAAGLFAVLIHVLVRRSLVRAETHRIAAADAARELAARVDQLHAAARERAALQAQLVEASRRAGRSDVATAVLHHAGNVVNSINVAAAMLGEVIARSKVRGLVKVAALVGSHRDDLLRFVRDDPRAAHLPAYLASLGDALARDRAAVEAELGALTRYVEQLKGILGSQEAHVLRGRYTERVDLGGLIDDAIAVDAGARTRAGVELRRELGPLPPLMIDRYKALQIVIHLLANACDAVVAHAGPARRIVVRTRRRADAIELEIADTGAGLAPDRLAAVFAGTGSTKPGHLGLGLHDSACAARELGGELSARSDGVGRGASFVLALPLGPAAAVAACERGPISAEG